MTRTRIEGSTEDASVSYFEPAVELTDQRGTDVAFTCSTFA